MGEFDKPIKVKPTFYAYCYYDLREIGREYGYNLVLHGSMARDMDLILIPWHDTLGDLDKLIDEFCDYLDGFLMLQYNGKENIRFGKQPQGRKSYIINLRRGDRTKYVNHVDAEYYLDISVTPLINDL